MLHIPVSYVDNDKGVDWASQCNPFRKSFFTVVLKKLSYIMHIQREGPDLDFNEEDYWSEGLLAPDDVDVEIFGDDLFPDGFHVDERPDWTREWPVWDIPEGWWTPFPPHIPL